MRIGHPDLRQCRMASKIIAFMPMVAMRLQQPWLNLSQIYLMPNLKVVEAVSSPNLSDSDSVSSQIPSIGIQEDFMDAIVYYSSSDGKSKKHPRASSGKVSAKNKTSPLRGGWTMSAPTLEDDTDEEDSEDADSDSSVHNNKRSATSQDEIDSRTQKKKNAVVAEGMVQDKLPTGTDSSLPVEELKSFAMVEPDQRPSI
ncbi:OLC1v1023688C1 [Oldenlandia corymbosa var. corymbosa]|uniref:OLC1v1023688C1 n=1 Tax=Oldenlandia corymbosa var. corymbosa TaxID=529605 RepID=A0AAV1C475_OLDCO|nr:OLC1v1023688C1 [Oldenlandia corymbosa var. corymbosa]